MLLSLQPQLDHMQPGYKTPVTLLFFMAYLFLLLSDISAFCCRLNNSKDSTCGRKKETCMQVKIFVCIKRDIKSQRGPSFTMSSSIIGPGTVAAAWGPNNSVFVPLKFRASSHRLSSRDTLFTSCSDTTEESEEFSWLETTFR